MRGVIGSGCYLSLRHGDQDEDRKKNMRSFASVAAAAQLALLAEPEYVSLVELFVDLLDARVLTFLVEHQRYLQNLAHSWDPRSTAQRHGDKDVGI